LKRVLSGAIVYYQFLMWSDLTHGIFTRKGGVSRPPWSGLNLGGTVGDDPAAVRRNHELIYEALGVEGQRVCSVWQVHGTDIVVATAPAKGRSWISKADALVTDRPGLPLMMRFADCVPILFHDPVKKVIGMAHAGWRGTVKGMASKTVQTMVTTYGCDPETIQACIGPSIGPERYQVGEEVVEAVQAYFGTTDDLIRRDPVDKTAYFDLWTANRVDLERAGVRQIEIAEICTATHTDEFFSHRAEKGRTGRFGAVMVL